LADRPARGFHQALARRADGLRLEDFKRGAGADSISAQTVPHFPCPAPGVKKRLPAIFGPNGRSQQPLAGRALTRVPPPFNR